MSRTREASIRSHLLFGFSQMAALVFGIGGMAGLTTLAGAVIAHGLIVVDSSVKHVQHLEGGVVGQILVREGDRVQAGQTLIRLDPTLTQSSLGIITKSLDQDEARLTRLGAERDDKTELAFPEDLSRRALTDPTVRDVENGERVLFNARMVARQGRRAQLRERASQGEEEVSGLQAQVEAKSKEIAFIEQELEGTRALWAKQLIPIQRVTEIERAAARLDGERGALISSIARSKASIAETELQILQIDQDAKSEVAKDIREVQGRIAEFSQRRIAAEETLRRLDIRSPQDGIVHQLAVHTVGGVIRSGDTLMSVVPQEDSLLIEARVSPEQVDQVFANQHAIVHFSAFDRSTTPEINALVSQVSPDLTQDPKTGASFYEIRLTFTAEELARLDDLKLVPGMPVESFIKTGNRTMLSYIMKPLQDQLSRSFRE